MLFRLPGTFSSEALVGPLADSRDPKGELANTPAAT